MPPKPPFVPAPRNAEVVWDKRLGRTVLYLPPYARYVDPNFDRPSGVGQHRKRHGHCQVHGAGCRKWLDRAHIVPRDNAGDDVEENIAIICRDLHRILDDGLSLGRELAAMEFRSSLADDQLDYVLSHPNGGQEWLDRTYPLPRAA